jgi:hypothetical protein
MIEKPFNFKLKALFFIIALILILFSFFIYNHARASILYDKFISAIKPSPGPAEILYYKDELYLIAEALRFSKDNANYYADKANTLFTASSRGFKQTLGIKKAEIESLYKKAIKLNPVNYQYHLNLGWFYAQAGKKNLAEKELTAASQLFPTNFQIYFYLAKYYLSNKKEKIAFGNLLLTFYYAPPFYWLRICPALREYLSTSSHILLNEKNREMRYVVFPLRHNFDFRNQGFPRRVVPLKIKIYLRNPVENATLEYKGYSFKAFSWQGVEAGYDVYETTLDSFSSRSSFDDFRIATNPSVNIEKIEFIYKF